MVCIRWALSFRKILFWYHHKHQPVAQFLGSQMVLYRVKLRSSWRLVCRVESWNSYQQRRPHKMLCRLCLLWKNSVHCHSEGILCYIYTCCISNSEHGRSCKILHPGSVATYSPFCGSYSDIYFQTYCTCASVVLYHTIRLHTLDPDRKSLPCLCFRIKFCKSYVQCTGCAHIVWWALENPSLHWWSSLLRLLHQTLVPRNERSLVLLLSQDSLILFECQPYSWHVKSIWKSWILWF